MRKVIVESPFKGRGATHEEGVQNKDRNRRYARAALRDCLDRGESPLASHLLYTQVLNDDKDDERTKGIQAGFAWADQADAVVFYTDLGISDGMRAALEHFINNLPEVKVEFRSLREWV